MASIFRLEDTRPQPGTNNIWFREVQSDRCIVFVHGINSDSRDCWYLKSESHIRSPSYWPEMAGQDARFQNFSIFLGGYTTGRSASSYSVYDCASELWQALQRKHPSSKRSVLGCDRIIFVCHSMGGIVVRHILEKHHHELKSKAIGLVLMASPSRGSDYADLLGPLTALIENSQALELRPGSSFLHYVHYRFERTLKEKRLPRFLGIEAMEHKGMVLGTEPIVSQFSAGTYFQDPVLLPGTNHSSAVKPTSPNDRSYLVLVDFCEAFAKEFDQPAHGNAPDAPNAPSFICESLRWEVSINSEGDAENEITFHNLIAQSVPVRLMSWHVQSGHSSDPQLAHGSSKNAALKLVRKGTHFAEVMLDKPAKTPVDLVIHDWDFNVYSMNTREYALKQSFGGNGVDYLEKWIDEGVGALELEVNFPKELRAAPWLSVHRGDSAETEDPALTSQYQGHFVFRPTTRTARLEIASPAPNHSYRVSWKVPEYARPANAPSLSIDEALSTLRSFAAHFFAEPAAAGPAIEAAARVLDLLQRFLLGEIQRAKGLRNEPVLRDLELSILVLDPETRPFVLRKVASNRPSDPRPAELGFEIGDGAAGRAYKKRMVRVYNSAEAARDPENNTYIKLENRPEHRFLISIPMINERDGIAYGVWNIGTFRATDTHYLSEVSKPEHAVGLLSGASKALTQLLRDLKLEE